MERGNSTPETRWRTDPIWPPPLPLIFVVVVVVATAWCCRILKCVAEMGWIHTLGTGWPFTGMRCETNIWLFPLSQSSSHSFPCCGYPRRDSQSRMASRPKNCGLHSVLVSFLVTGSLSRRLLVCSSSSWCIPPVLVSETYRLNVSTSARRCDEHIRSGLGSSVLVSVSSWSRLHHRFSRTSFIADNSPTISRWYVVPETITLLVSRHLEEKSPSLGYERSLVYECVTAYPGFQTNGHPVVVVVVVVGKMWLRLGYWHSLRMLLLLLCWLSVYVLCVYRATATAGVSMLSAAGYVCKLHTGNHRHSGQPH